MARLRRGRAHTARGAANFLRETVSRVRHARATGQLTVRADSGFYTHAIVAAGCDQGVRYSITVRQHAQLRNQIEAVPEADWTPIPYWMEGAADVVETEYTPFRSEPDATPVRLIVAIGDTQEHNQAGADPSDLGGVDGDGGGRYALEKGAHDSAGNFATQGCRYAGTAVR